MDADPPVRTIDPRGALWVVYAIDTYIN